jgi:hypothetical protein
MASTLVSASRSAAGSMADASNWLSAAASSAISVTRKRAKCAVMPATFASIADVTGSRMEFEDGVIIPRRLRLMIFASLNRSTTPAPAHESRSNARQSTWGLVRRTQPDRVRGRATAFCTPHTICSICHWSATYASRLSSQNSRDRLGSEGRFTNKPSISLLRSFPGSHRSHGFRFKYCPHGGQRAATSLCIHWQRGWSTTSYLLDSA